MVKKNSAPQAKGKVKKKAKKSTPKPKTPEPKTITVQDAVNLLASQGIRIAPDHALQLAQHATNTHEADLLTTEETPTSESAQLRVIAARKKAFINAMVQTLGIASKAAKASQIPLRTHYHWMETDEAYRDAIKDVRELALDAYEEALHDLVKQRNPAAVIFALKTQGKKRGYIETVHNMNQNFDDNNVHFYIPDNERDGVQDANVVE